MWKRSSRQKYCRGKHRKYTIYLSKSLSKCWLSRWISQVVHTNLILHAHFIRVEIFLKGLHLSLQISFDKWKVYGRKQVSLNAKKIKKLFMNWYLAFLLSSLVFRFLTKEDFVSQNQFSFKPRSLHSLWY